MFRLFSVRLGGGGGGRRARMAVWQHRLMHNGNMASKVAIPRTGGGDPDVRLLDADGRGSDNELLRHGGDGVHSAVGTRGRGLRRTGRAHVHEVDTPRRVFKVRSSTVADLAVAGDPLLLLREVHPPAELDPADVAATAQGVGLAPEHEVPLDCHAAQDRGLGDGPHHAPRRRLAAAVSRQLPTTSHWPLATTSHTPSHQSPVTGRWALAPQPPLISHQPLATTRTTDCAFVTFVLGSVHLVVVEVHVGSIARTVPLFRLGFSVPAGLAQVSSSRLFLL